MSVARKTAVIMLGMMSIEGWVLWLSFQRSTRGQIVALYNVIPAGWLASALAVVVSAFFVGHAIRTFPAIGERFLDLRPLKFLAIPFAAITGSMEELWFRKAAMDSVQRHGGGILLQIAVSAVLFGLIHAVWGLFAGKWRVATGSMIATGALGAALAIIYLVGGRQLAPCVWAHIAINLAIEPWLLLAAVSGRLSASMP